MTNLKESDNFALPGGPYQKFYYSQMGDEDRLYVLTQDGHEGPKVWESQVTEAMIKLRALI